LWRFKLLRLTNSVNKDEELKSKKHWSNGVGKIFKAASKVMLWTGSNLQTVGADLENAKGAGDIIATGTKSTAIDKAFEWFATSVLGRKGCGCRARRAWLNSLCPFEGPKLIIAIPEYNDRAGAWAMIESLREEIRHSSLCDKVEILWLTQTPTIKAPLRHIRDFGQPTEEELPPLPTEVIDGPEPLKAYCEMASKSGVKCHYVEFTKVIGTSPAKRACIEHAKALGGEWVWICDSHLSFKRGSVDRFYKWVSRHKNRSSKALYHCPLLYDGDDGAFTHLQTRDKKLALIGGDKLWGQFRQEMELLKEGSQPREIEAHGGFFMAMRTDFALQPNRFGHPLFKGFSDPETILQEQRRAAGEKVYCLPSWMVSCHHRFLRVRHNDYHSPWTDALRNHVIGVESLRVHFMKEAVSAGYREPVEWLMAAWARSFPGNLREIQQTAMSAMDEYRSWVLEQARLREEAKAKSEAAEKPQEAKPFHEIYEKQQWGSGETVSGPGSTLAATETLRAKLGALLHELQVQSFLDIPCGDHNWMSKVEFPSGCSYVGADVVESLVTDTKSKYPALDFRVLDIRTSDLPKCDVVFTRDCLVHLPYADIQQALENIKRSGAKWLMATHFPGRTNHDIPSGHWRPLDMTADPILLPTPKYVLNEDCKEGDGAFRDKSIGVWDLDELRTAK